MNRINGSWYQISTVAARRFTCGHCGSDVSAEKAYYCSNVNGVNVAQCYLCHDCNRPSLFFDQEQVPAPRLGISIPNLPKDINDIYDEIRQSTAANAYTAAILASRKLLMHIAVEAGAKAGESFQAYVNYLVDNHYTPPNSKGWVDKIRELGNEANHEIVIMGQVEAGDVIKFLEMILRFMYEFQAPVPNTQVSSPTMPLN